MVADGRVNEFYRDFDAEAPVPEAPDFRGAFQRARDRLVHNSSFRRLQSKTQVFLSGEYDFYRTRLTHSIEVAQIAGSLTRWLNHDSDELGPGFHVDVALCEAAALAHDIGHPPFGHAGEGTLHRLMRPHGGFEGNAQTLRLITETIFTSGRSARRGLNPPRALIDAVLKYKTLHGEAPDAGRHYLYDDQRRFVDFVCGGRPFPEDLPAGPARNGFRSVECQIMDWADDVAYSVNDLVDGVNAGFVSIRRLEGWAAENALDREQVSHVERLLAAIREGLMERRMNRKIGAFVEGCGLARRTTFLSDLTHRHAFELVVPEPLRREQKLYNRIATDLVFRSPQVCQLEHKGRVMLTRIFRTLEDHYITEAEPRLVLLSRDYEREIAGAADASGRARIICDYLAGMTDGYAARIYKRLFDPDFGSIVDLV
ncbi:MAG: dNTP triphosphohydrolase [Candidatus Krumholzibacteriia bacterium]